MEPAEVSDLFQWQQSRRRPDGAFGEPTSGFGPGGKCTLWLPPSVPQTVWKFVNGKPVTELVDAAELDVRATELRRAVLAGSRANLAAGTVIVEASFLEYASHVLRRNYTLSDEDLGWALFQSRAWHRAMIVHVLGGPDMVDALTASADMRDLAREAAGREHLAAMVANEAPTPAAPPIVRERAAGGRGGLFSRFRSVFGGRKGETWPKT